MKKGIVLSFFFLLVVSSLTFAGEINIVRMQGVVMSLDLKKSAMVVNETLFVWNQKTTFQNSSGAPITADKLKTKGWVYIEGENDKALKRCVATKIYLLPKFIKEKELHLYPFIEQN